MMKFCSHCGNPTGIKIPPGDNRLRSVCSASECGMIHYVNPNVIVCTLPVWKDQVLLCKRAIQPRLGYWTLPGGFMECKESTEQGAIRETIEEAGADIKIKQLYRVFDMPHINQVYIIYLADMQTPLFDAGEESLEVALYSEENIPWDDMAFTVMKLTLEEYFSERELGSFSIKNTLISKDMLMQKV